MKYLLSAFATLLFAVAPNVAHAADVATLSCVRDQLAPATAVSIRESAKRRIAGESKEDVPAAARTQLNAAATLCKNRHKWSDAAAEAASQYTLAALGREGVTELAVSRGINAANVETAVGGMSADEGAKLLKGEPEGIMAYIRELQELGISMADLENVGQIYGALAAVILLQRNYRATFEAS